MEGNISEEEEKILNQWYHTEYNETISWDTDKSREDLKKRLFQSILSRINKEEDADKPGKLVSIRRNWYKPAAAAAIIIFLLTGAYFIYTNQNSGISPQAVANKEIPPGSDKAILTLADGSQIVLTDAGNGAIADQGNVKVIKLDGLVSYSLDGSTEEVVYNTISTPRTGQYQLLLADGTRVWLDAESSIRFPNVFKGKERRVELKGQGYFEVAHNSKMPFHVSVGKMNVEVLGTHFNIMAYGDEDAIKTTLLEGSVKVQILQGPAQTTILKPGSQARLSKNNVLKTVQNVNMDQAIAWKNGLFQLEGTSIREVFRQIERWYDVEVIMQGNFNDDTLSGVFSRKQYVSQLISILEEAGVGHFKIEGRKIYVTI